MLWQDPLVSTAQITQHCVDPAYFMRSVFTGIACNPPGTGTVVYAQLPDKSCLNLVMVQANGTKTPAIVRVDPTLGLTFWVRLLGIEAPK